MQSLDAVGVRRIRAQRKPPASWQKITKHLPKDCLAAVLSRLLANRVCRVAADSLLVVHLRPMSDDPDVDGRKVKRSSAPLPPPTAKITLGDLFQRVALTTHRELEGARAVMRGMDPELRTKYLRTFVSKTLKRLLQLFAICQWVSGPGIQQFFTSVAELYRQLSLVGATLNETQDKLFWAHSYVFAMRSRPLEVGAAMDLMAARGYPYLPQVIFSCGRVPTPGTKLDKAAVVRDCEVFIRAKLGLARGGGGGGICAGGDALPAGLDAAYVSNGTLTLQQNNVYRVTLSLLHLEETAPWVVLDSQVPFLPFSPHPHFQFSTPQLFFTTLPSL